jgi:hypothetical protein
MLMNRREYPQAADFLQAGAAGDDAARTLGLANMLRGAIHHEDVKFANTPEDMVKRFALVPFDANHDEREAWGDAQPQRAEGAECRWMPTS